MESSNRIDLWFGNNCFPYSSNFYSHQLVAFLLFCSVLSRIQDKPWGVISKWTLVEGLMLGFALISEYPSILIASAVFIYSVLTSPLPSVDYWTSDCWISFQEYC